MDAKLGKFVRDARERLGLNQTEMGGILGLHQAGVSKLESGEQNLLAADYLKIVGLLKQQDKMQVHRSLLSLKG
jgi:transcriptional regulator with XRE-family HTH domain